jgi:hypothetical protein
VALILILAADTVQVAVVALVALAGHLLVQPVDQAVLGCNGMEQVTHTMQAVAVLVEHLTELLAAQAVQVAAALVEILPALVVKRVKAVAVVVEVVVMTVLAVEAA